MLYRHHHRYSRSLISAYNHVQVVHGFEESRDIQQDFGQGLRRTDRPILVPLSVVRACHLIQEGMALAPC